MLEMAYNSLAIERDRMQLACQLDQLTASAEAVKYSMALWIDDISQEIEAHNGLAAGDTGILDDPRASEAYQRFSEISDIAEKAAKLAVRMGHGTAQRTGLAA